MPNTSYITNTYDANARLLSTALKNSNHSTLNAHTYTYNVGNQRTQQSFGPSGSTYNYRHDKIGQLTIADSATASEDRGYAYDPAWNLTNRTVNTTAQTFKVDGLNQLTNAPVNITRKHDGNGNMTNSGPLNTLKYTYDAENQLVSPENPSWKHEFTYDGQGRLRKQQDYTWVSMAGYVLSGSLTYQYDGMRVIQERNTLYLLKVKTKSRVLLERFQIERHNGAMRTAASNQLAVLLSRRSLTVDTMDRGVGNKVQSD